MAVALTLKALGVKRRLYLFDTFNGMTASDDKIDVDRFGAPVSAEILQYNISPIEEVCSNMNSTGYTGPIIYVAGDVLTTIPEKAPESIALLRLDTDWHDSTEHELQYLFPKLSPGGILIVDDYGHWAGSKLATDEYFQSNRIPFERTMVGYSVLVHTR